jgi:hypothetical protein
MNAEQDVEPGVSQFGEESLRRIDLRLQPQRWIPFLEVAKRQAKLRAEVTL